MARLRGALVYQKPLFSFGLFVFIKLVQTFLEDMILIIEISLPRKKLRAILSRLGCSILGIDQKQVTSIKLRYSIVSTESNGRSCVLKTQFSLKPFEPILWPNYYGRCSEIFAIFLNPQYVFFLKLIILPTSLATKTEFHKHYFKIHFRF